MLLLMLCLLLPLCAGAEGLLVAPFPEEAPESIVADAVASLLGRQVASLPDLNGAEAVNAMLAQPETLLLDTQAALFLSLQGYTAADCREAMRPVCCLGRQDLVLVMDAAAAMSRGIKDASSFRSWMADHEYELLIARFVDPDVIDYASFLLEQALPVLSETCFDREEALDALSSDMLQLLVLPAASLPEGVLPLFSLGSAPSPVLTDLPCAVSLGWPVCDGITLSLYASAALPQEEAAALADTLSAALLQEAPATLADALTAAGFTTAFLAGEAFTDETAAAFASYASYMTSEGLFFYEQ